jgi:hypothetical protein
MSLHGNGLLASRYNYSLQQLLAAVYPEYDWLPWKFLNCPVNYFGNVQNDIKFVDWAGLQLNVKELSDWYKVKTVVSV